MVQQLLQDQTVTFSCLVLNNWWRELVSYQANSALIVSSFGRCFLWVEASNAPGDKCSVSAPSLLCPWDCLLLLSITRVDLKSLNFNQIEIAFFFFFLSTAFISAFTNTFKKTLLWEWSKQFYVQRRNENDLSCYYSGKHFWCSAVVTWWKKTFSGSVSWVKWQSLK